MFELCTFDQKLFFIGMFVFYYLHSFAVVMKPVCDENVTKCGWNNWEPWGTCDGPCEARLRKRSRRLCCEKGQNFTECLLDCNIRLEESAKNATESEPCAICNNGGDNFSIIQHCRDPKYYKGKCFDNCKKF